MKKYNQPKKGAISRIVIFTLFWLFVQIVVISILAQIGLCPSNFFPAGRYGVRGVIGVFYGIACYCLGLVYTIVGVVVSERMGINTKRWWKSVGYCFLVYVIVTTVGMLAVQGEWFREGFWVFLLDMWFAPVLWLAELEIVHLYWENQRRLYLERSENEEV